MTYEAVAYYPGPKTLWEGKICPNDIVARHPAPFRWLAQMRLRALQRDLNASRCGFILLYGDDVLEHIEPDLSIPES